MHLRYLRQESMHLFILSFSLMVRRKNGRNMRTGWWPGCSVSCPSACWCMTPVWRRVGSRKICLPLVKRGVYLWREYCLHFHVKGINRSSFRKDKHGPLHFVSQNKKTIRKDFYFWVIKDKDIRSCLFTSLYLWNNDLLQSFGFHFTQISREKRIFKLKPI